MSEGPTRELARILCHLMLSADSCSLLCFFSDAVLLDVTPSHPSPVLASAKSPTTPDVTLGIQSAIKLALEKAGSSVDLTRAEAVNIGTTHFVNALIERNVKRLDRVAVIRCASSKSLVFLSSD